MSIEIICGEARETLAALPASSVQCVMTSPPYFGLRSYQTAGQVWGGDQACTHTWSAASRALEQGNKRTPVDTDHDRDRSQDKAVPQTVALATARCASCDAWRGELGAEDTPQEYVAHLVEVFRAVHRVLRDDGTCWIVIGDSYASAWPCSRRSVVGQGSMPDVKRAARPPRMGHGLKDKDLVMIPHRVALALQEDGWYVRQELVWSKPAPMPESVRDRCTRSHEFIFMLAKQERYYYDADAIREPHQTVHPQRDWRTKDYPSRGMPGEKSGPGGYKKGAPAQAAGNHPGGRNKRSVWSVGPQPLADAHYATFPEALVMPMVLAGTSEAGCCPRCGAPWRRRVERTPRDDRAVVRTRNAGGRSDGFTRTKASGGLPPVDRQTTGWQAGCSCEAGPPIPCTVLDPFAGSGTTLLVARRLGRSAIGVELNPSYCDLARKRVDSSPESLFSAAAYQDHDARPAPASCDTTGTAQSGSAAR